MVAEVDPFDETAARTRRDGERTAERHPGDRIDRFEIVEVLGRGGMGVVYAARDPHLDRTIALKLLGVRDGPDGARVRLVREARAMARVAHPAVVAVFDAGTFAGDVWVAMERVGGGTLGAWLRTPRPWREVVARFVAAGRGLAAAHAAGLVHRDFKPDNVLVRDGGGVCVADFGLARATIEAASSTAPSGAPSALASVTESDAIAGTPAYMSPEQHLGRAIDARSDQFSFCVACWEALYRRRPFSPRAPGLSGIAAAVLDGQIDAPPRGTPVPAWIERTLRRGLAVDPSRRWPDLPSLLGELERIPRRRRRVAIAASALALIATTAGISRELHASGPDRLAACGVRRHDLDGAWSPARRLALAHALLAIPRPWVEPVRVEVERRLDDYAAAWSGARVALCEDQQRGELSAAALDLRTTCLDRSRRRFDGAIGALIAGDEGVAARALTTVAQFDDVAACANLDELSRPTPRPAALRPRIDAAEAVLAEVETLVAVGKRPEAVARLTALEPEVEAIDFAPLTAEALYWRGVVADGADDLQAARDLLFRSALAAEAGHDDRRLAEAEAELTHLVGDRLGKRDEGLREAAHGEAAITALGGDVRLETKLANARATVLIRSDRADEATAELRRALALAEANPGAVSEDAVGVLRANLAGELVERGQLPAAFAEYDRALSTFVRLYGPTHPRSISVRGSVASAHFQNGDTERGLAELVEVLRLEELAFGADSPRLAPAIANLASANEQLGDHGVAIELYQRVLTIKRASVGDDDPMVTQLSSNLANSLASAGRLDEALAVAQHNVEVTDRRDPDDATLTRGLFNLALILGELHRPAEALPYLARARVLARVDPSVEVDWNIDRAEGEALRDLGRPAEARIPMARALAAIADDPIEQAITRFDLMTIDYRLGARTGAVKLARETRAVLAAAPDRARELAMVDAWLAHPGAR